MSALHCFHCGGDCPPEAHDRELWLAQRVKELEAELARERGYMDAEALT